LPAEKEKRKRLADVCICFLLPYKYGWAGLDNCLLPEGGKRRSGEGDVNEKNENEEKERWKKCKKT